MNCEIILVGNPNTGKTTLFNTLSKSFEKASNWHGVTVMAKSKKIKLKNDEFLLTDLPGVYSLEGYSKEEKDAVKYLLEKKKSLIVNVCDANNFRRNFKLVCELVKEGFEVIVAVNMSKEIKLFDYEKLSRDFGIAIVEIDAISKVGIVNLKTKILEVFQYQKTQNISKNNKISSINSDILKKYAVNTQKEPYKTSDKIDKFVLNKWLFWIIFFGIIFLVFYLTFGVFGEWFSQIFNNIFSLIFTKMRKIIYRVNMSNILKIFIAEAVLKSVESVIVFLPQIVLLMSFFNLLEDIGFMSRVAFMLDGLLRKFGVTGKSIFSFFMGFGCSTSAVLTTRNLENESLRKRTILIVPFASCSAKLPVFLVVASLFFERYKYLFVFGLYVFSILISFLVAMVFQIICPANNDFFVMELPKYRLPNFKKICRDLIVVVKDFVCKIAGVILMFGVLVWCLQNFSLDLKFLNSQNFEESILYSISNFLLPIFKPIGFTNVGIIVALIFGFVAKEMIVVGLAMINGVTASALAASLLSASSVCYFTPQSSIVFLVFVLLYSPCVSALATIKNEVGVKQMIFVFCFQFALAYGVSFLINLILNFGKLRLIFVMLFVFALIACCVLKLSKKHCKGNCYDCRRI